MAIEDLVTQIQTEDAPASDAKSAISRDSADTTQGNVSESLVDELKGEDGAIDGSRAEKRIKGLLGDLKGSKELISNQSSIIGAMQKEMEALKNMVMKPQEQNGNPLSKFSVQDLQASLSDPEISDDKKFMVMNEIVNRHVGERLNSFTKEKETESKKRMQADIVGGLIQKIGGEEVYDKNSDMHRLAMSKLESVKSITDVEALQQLVAVLAAKHDDLVPKLTSLTNERRSIDRRNMIESGTRRINSSVNGLGDFLGKNRNLSLSKQGRTDGSIGEALERTNFFQGLKKEFGG